ncbi:MAG: hypothetical protein NVSMB32_13480 [Actinomycetota bacterium]
MDAIARFAALARLPERELDLAEAALLIGAAAYPGLETAPWLAQIDRYAAGVADLEGLLQRCFGQLGLRGDTKNYYDPDNSFLHRVLARRVGIPISLSVLTIEIGRRAGIRLEGVGMPGHFLVGVPGRGLCIDTFGGGKLLDLAGCESRFRESVGAGPEVEFGPHMLPIVGPQAILIRMLANLSVVYDQRRSGADLEWVARLRLVLPDVSATEVLALGSALEMQGRFVDAARELERGAVGGLTGADKLLSTARRMRARNN